MRHLSYQVCFPQISQLHLTSTAFIRQDQVLSCPPLLAPNPFMWKDEVNELKANQDMKSTSLFLMCIITYLIIIIVVLTSQISGEQTVYVFMDADSQTTRHPTGTSRASRRTNPSRWTPEASAGCVRFPADAGSCLSNGAYFL